MELTKNRPRNHCPPPPSPYPWLVYCHGKTMKRQTFYSISDPQNIHVRSIPELRNKNVWNSCHGWLVLSSELAETDFHLWNPATLESVMLPPLDLIHLKPKQYITECLLTAPPDHPDSSFLLFVYDPRSTIFCFIQDKKWITRGYDKKIKDMEVYLCRPLTCNNKIYAPTSDYKEMAMIEIIKPSRMVIRFHNFPIPYVPSYLVLVVYSLCLVESVCNIFAIETNYRGFNDNDMIGFQIYRFIVRTMTWEQVDSCPGRAFFISDSVSISCSTIHSEIENRIYFTKDGDNRLYSFSIEDKSISVSLPCPRIATPWKTPFWIKPNIGSFDSFVENSNSFNEKQEAMERLDKCTKVDRGEKKIHLLDLPKHIVERIVPHLSLFDYMNFRVVSRGCRSAAPPKKWRTNSVELESNTLSPWLMFPVKVKSVQSLVDTKLGGKHYVTIPQVLEGFMVTYSKYGWLLMWKRDSSIL